jgi:hypothetical protein
MQTSYPPTIPAAAQFKSIQNNADNIVYGNTISTGNLTSGGILSVVDGQDQTYSASTVAGGMITRTGIGSSSSDVLPSPNSLAAALGLITINGISYVKTFGIYNTTTYQITLSGDDWTFVNNNTVRGEFGYTIMYNITYTTNDGWTASCMFTGQIDLS